MSIEKLKRDTLSGNTSLLGTNDYIAKWTNYQECGAVFDVLIIKTKQNKTKTNCLEMSLCY